MSRTHFSAIFARLVQDLRLLGIALGLACVACPARAQVVNAEGRLGVVDIGLTPTTSRPVRHANHTDRNPVRVLPESVAAPLLPESAWTELDAFWTEMASSSHLPGLAIAVVQVDGPVFERCLGQRLVTSSDPVNSQTLFNLGPATLALTTLLAATGDQPETPIFERRAATVSPLFRLTDTQAQRTCRLRDLLAMNAGVPTYSDRILDPLWSRPEDVFAALGQAPIMSPPGERYQYSELSAAAGGYLVAMQLGDRHRKLLDNYREVMRERLFVPLGFQQSTFSEKEAKEDGNRASSHQVSGDRYDPFFPDVPDEHPLAPLLGLKMSLDDAVLWLRAELTQGVAANGERIAPGLSVRERWQPVDVDNSSHRGLGWTRDYHDGIEIIHATGNHAGQSASVGILPAYRTAYVVFVNAAGNNANAMMECVRLALAESLHAGLEQKGTPPIAHSDAP